MNEEQGSGNHPGEVVIPVAPDGGGRVEVIVGDEAVCLTRAEMVALFGRDRSRRLQ